MLSALSSVARRRELDGLRVLDAGCGEGFLSAELSALGADVTAIDVDMPTLDAARGEVGRRGGRGPVTFVLGDVMAHPFGAASFDGVVSIAVLHHLHAARALARFGQLVRRGGVVAVVGLARARAPADLPYDVAGSVATAV
ncbi:MAG TPA: class I SAM-dependent methyltransferase, partial [Acidimicrobiales bacterium]|nr:class I SAM-dependent methyltransferase [Acidimicrobiales bacterium]